MRKLRWCIGVLCALALSSLQAEVPARETTLPASAAAHSLSAVRPVMIGGRHLAAAKNKLARQLLGLARAGGDAKVRGDDAELVTRPFAGDVVVAYAVGAGEAGHLVSRAMMEAWGMDPERLHARALANLEDGQGELRIKPVDRLPWLHVIAAEDGYAASRVLLAWHWPAVAERLGGRLVLAMPSQDVVVLTVTRDADKLARLRETVETVESHQVRPVSAQLFEWTGTDWRPMESGD